MKFLPLLLPLLASITAATEWNVVSHIPRERFVVQSHRGAGVLAAENTIAAFELGWKLGTYPEGDIRSTRDGVIVTFHDNTFNRVVKELPETLRDRGVKDVTWDELTRLEVGAWEGGAFMAHRVPRLSEVLAAMQGRPERHLYLDVKQVDLAQLAVEISRAGVAAQVILAAPDPAVLRAWKRLLPEAETLLWMRGSERQLDERLRVLREEGFAGITQLQIHIFPHATFVEALAISGVKAAALETTVEAAAQSPEPFTLSRDFIRRLGADLRAAGVLFQALPYTDDASVYGQLLDLGLASFATDRPDAFNRALEAYYKDHGRP